MGLSQTCFTTVRCGRSSASETSITCSTSAWLMVDIMELLCLRRCRVLKRVPKASRIPYICRQTSRYNVLIQTQSINWWIWCLSGLPALRYLGSVAANVIAIVRRQTSTLSLAFHHCMFSSMTAAVQEPSVFRHQPCEGSDYNASASNAGLLWKLTDWQTCVWQTVFQQSFSLCSVAQPYVPLTRKTVGSVQSQSAARCVLSQSYRSGQHAASTDCKGCTACTVMPSNMAAGFLPVKVGFPVLIPVILFFQDLQKSSPTIRPTGRKRWLLSLQSSIYQSFQSYLKDSLLASSLPILTQTVCYQNSSRRIELTFQRRQLCWRSWRTFFLQSTQEICLPLFC